MRSLAALPLLAAAVASLTLFAGRAHAEPSSFLSAAGGWGLQHDAIAQRDNKAGAISFALGVGSSPANRLVIGGLFRLTTYPTLGTDLGLNIRAASGGFARGDYGLALDVGPGFRAWGNGDSGKWPVQARIVGGAPWGIELSVGGDFYNLTGDGPYARGINVLAGVDLLRLTIMRQGSSERFWENRHPVGGHIRPE